MSQASAAPVVVWLRRMGRLPGLVFLALLVCSAGRASARGSQPVVIVRPEPATCIDADALAVAMANAGALLPSVVPEDVARDAPSGTVVFRIDPAGSGLRVRGWGLARETPPGALEEWPAPWTEHAPDIDREIAAPECATATEAAVAFLVSMLAPRADDENAAELRAQQGSQLASLLERASAELAQRSQLTPGVLHTELGLTFIVEDMHASCRRGTWLDLRGAEPRMGQSVTELERDVLACLDRRELDERQKGLRPRLTSRAGAERFGLPQVSGGLLAAAGGTAAAYAALKYDNPGPVLAFTALPAVAGGIGGYLLEEPGQEGLWLAGYWSAVAGSALVAGAQRDSDGRMLVGGFLMAGAATSAALVLADAVDDGEGDLPAWVIGAPALAGSALAWGALVVAGYSDDSAQIAALGSVAAVLPVFWVALGRDPPADAGVSAPSFGLVVGDAAAYVQLRGEL